METINNIATAARNSVFGDNSQTAKPDTEPPSVGVPGKGTPDAPFDRGNEPEQAQSDGRPAETKAETLVTPPTPASKIDNPDPAVPSEMKSAVSANDAAKSVNPTATSTTTASGAGSETDSKVKPSKATQPYSHSALFGLGTKENGTKGDVHPPKDSGNLSGTCEEAGKGLTKQAAMEEKGANEDDTGGYVGLKKAAMEEEERKKKEEENQESGGDSNVVSEWKSLAAKDAEDRNPSTSYFLYHLTSERSRSISSFSLLFQALRFQ